MQASHRSILPVSMMSKTLRLAPTIVSGFAAAEKRHADPLLVKTFRRRRNPESRSSPASFLFRGVLAE
jgi:hypothetical protein